VFEHRPTSIFIIHPTNPNFDPFWILIFFGIIFVIGLVSTNKTRILRDLFVEEAQIGVSVFASFFYFEVKWFHQIRFTEAASDTRSQAHMFTLLCSVHVQCLNRGNKSLNRTLNYRLRHLYHHLSSPMSHLLRSEYIRYFQFDF